MLRRLASFMDLTGPDGRLSFSKMVLLTVLALSAVTGTFGLGIAVAAIAGSFGRSTFMAFLQRHQSTTSHAMTTDTAKVIEAIRARRDEASGTEPTP